MADHKSCRDLVGFAKIAERHWKQFRPKLYKYLKKQGSLHDHLCEAGEQAEKYIQKVQARPGYNPTTDYLAAKEVALSTWIYLPDIDDEVDET